MKKNAASIIVGISATSGHKKMATFASPLAFDCSKFQSVKFHTQKDDQLDDAVSRVHEMLKMVPKPDVRHFNELLGGIAKMREYHVVLLLFGKMRQNGARIDDFTMDIAVNCYCLINRVDLSFVILSLFLKTGYEPSTITFTTFLKGLFLANDINGAERLLRKVMNLNLCEPNDVMYLTVVNGLCKTGKLKTAVDLLETCKCGVNAYTAVISSLCKKRKISDAYNIFRKMVESGLEPDIFTYNTLIDGCCKVGNIYEARRLFNQIPSVGLECGTFTCNTMLKGLFDVGRCAEAMELFYEMETRVELNVITYIIVTDGLCKNNRATEALSVMTSMEEKGVNLEAGMFTPIIQVLCNNGDLDGAKYVFNKLLSRGLPPTDATCRIIIGALYKSGMDEEASHFVNRLKGMGCLPAGDILRTLKRSTCRQSLS